MAKIETTSAINQIHGKQFYRDRGALLPSMRGGKGQKSPKMTYVLAYVIFFAYLCSRKGLLA